MTCNFWGPHAPFLPSDEYLGTHDRAAIEPWENYADPLTDKPERIKHEQSDFYRRRPRTWDGWREIVGLCYDFVSMIDAQIGRIVDKLAELDIADDTVVMLTSDHGDMIGSHNQMFDKGLIYEEAHHIPLIASWPGEWPPAVCNDLVSNMDLMPTVLGLCGRSDGTTAEELDGRSLEPALRGDSSRDRRQRLLLEFHGIRYLYSERAIVTSDGWKYVFNPADIDEVYHLASDPAELTNLVDSSAHAETIERLRRDLMATVIEAGDPIRGAVCKLLGH